MFKSLISLKLGTIDGCGEILTSTKKQGRNIEFPGIYREPPPKNDKIYSFLHN